MNNKKFFGSLFFGLLIAATFFSGALAPQTVEAAAPTFNSFSSIAASTGVDVTVNLPAHQANDIMLLLGWVRDVNDTVTITTATGWTQLATWDRGTASRYWLFWKRATSGAETNPVFNKSGSTGDTYAAAITYRGAITTGDPWEVVGAASTGTVDPSIITGITSLSDEALIVVPVGGENNNNNSIITTGTNPAAYAEHYVESTTGANGVITFSEAARTTAGATGNISVNWNSAVPVGTGGRALSLKPAPITTTTALITSGSPSVYGSNVTFTATVTPASGGAPSGTVTFKDGVTTIGTGVLNGANPGVATFVINNLSVAGSPHSITAEYGGDANHSGSTSSAVSQTTTAKILTVTGITASNKEYDGNAAATLNTVSATLVGVVSGDSVTLNTASAVGTFSDKNVGTGKTVQVSSLTISGANASNYTLTQPTTTADITTKALTVTGMTASNKVYDATTNATLNDGTLVGVVGGDIVSINTRTGAFATKTVGTAKQVNVTSVTLTGTDAGNYTVTNPTGITADIAVASLTITGVTANNKIYDGGQTATLSGSATLSGVLLSDVVSLGGTPSASFADKTVGIAKPVTVIGYTISGADSGNYTLSQPSGLTANITVRTLTVSATGVNKIYDANTTATVNLFDDRVLGDTLTASYTSASFVDKNVGVAKTVNVSGISVSGADSANYTYNTIAATTANITARPITVTATTNTKTYDSTTSAAATPTITSGVLQGTDTANFSETYATKTVGTGKTLIPSGSVTDGNSGLNYSVTFVNDTTGVITAASLAVTGMTASNKVYDATTNVTLNSGTLVGVVGGDVISINTRTGVFATKTVGTAKQVNVTSVTLTGTDAGNYTVTNPTGITADITVASLSVTGVTANNKEYDGNVTAILNTASAVLVGVLGSDSVALNTAGAIGTFDTQNIGTGKTVTVSGLTLSGTDAGNYSLIQPTTTANITAHSLTVSGIIANNKEYNGNATAILNTTSAVLVGVQSGDSVSLNTSLAAGTFDNKNIGTGKIVTVSGLTISGADAGNYTLIQLTTTADITAKNLTITGVTADNKEYDGNTTATLNTVSTTLVGVVSGDSVSLNTAGATGTFDNKNIGTGKTVTVSGLTISGTDSGNYTLTQPTTTADITIKTLTVSGMTAANKVYDTTTDVVLSGGSLVGIVGLEDVSVNTRTGAFATKTVGTAKQVNVTSVTLTGTDAGNYTVTNPTGITADITAASLSVTGVTADNKVYDGNTDATLNVASASLVGVLLADSVTLNTGSAVGTFDTADVGTGKTVTVSGLTISGTDSGNYTLTQPTTTANITNRTLTVTGITANNKIYDGTTIATLTTAGAILVGVRGGDDVTLNTAGAVGTFDNKNIGTGKTVTVSGLTITGADAHKYTLIQPTTTADITAKNLTVSDIVANNKEYDGNTTATLNTVSAALIGVVGLDDVALDIASAVGTFDTPDIGTGKIVTVSGLALSGTESGNYSLTQPTTTANIAEKLLTVTGMTAANKVYDATTSATLSGGTLVGVVIGDDVSINTRTGIFSDKNVGTGKTVTVSSVTLTGAQAAKYTVSNPVGITSDITSAGLSVAGITAIDKIYDGNTTAVLNTASAALSGLLGSDVVSLDTASTTGVFDTPDVGAGKIVTVSGLTISGTDAGNYTLTQPTTTASITSAPPAGDTTAPADISDLASTGVSPTSIALAWTAPGDDGVVGAATSYDVRYSTSTITNLNFDTATQIIGESTPSVAGSSESLVVSGLATSTTYYFAIKTSDEVPNTSGISNILNATTSAEPVIPTPDTIAPAAITDLALSDATTNSIKLTWTAPGDDGNVGTATGFYARYSTTPLSEVNWTSATQVIGEPTPQVSGTSQTMTVSGLASNTTYYFGIKTLDDVDNESDVSNVPSLATLAIVTPPTPPTPTPTGGGITAGGVQPTGIIFAGQAYPGGKVELLRRSRIDDIYRNIPVSTYEMSPAGKFRITLTALLQSEYYFGLVATDKNGEKSGMISFTADLLSRDTLAAENIIFPPTITLPKTTVGAGDNLVINGYAGLNSRIVITIDDIIVGEASANNGGLYSYSTSTAGMGRKTYVLKVKQKINGKESDYSTTKLFTVSSLELPRADLNGDGKIDAKDTSIFMSLWGSSDTKAKMRIDMDGNGRVDIADFSIFLRAMR